MIYYDSSHLPRTIVIPLPRYVLAFQTTTSPIDIRSTSPNSRRRVHNTVHEPADSCQHVQSVCISGMYITYHSVREQAGILHTNQPPTAGRTKGLVNQQDPHRRDRTKKRKRQLHSSPSFSLYVVRTCLPPFDAYLALFVGSAEVGLPHLAAYNCNRPSDRV